MKIRILTNLLLWGGAAIAAVAVVLIAANNPARDVVGTIGTCCVLAGGIVSVVGPKEHVRDRE